MGMRFRFLPGLLIPVLLFGLSGCKTSSSSNSSSGTGSLYVSTQGDSLVSAYTIDLSTGLLTVNGAGVATGTTPSAMLLSPSGDALFIANSATNNISTYAVKSDGSLTAGSSTLPTGMTPLSVAIDSAAHFLFVANQGLQIDPASGTISVFSIQSGSLAEVAGSPFRVAALSASSGPGPAAVAVTPDAKFLYVANQFDGTLTGFSVDASGVLTRLTPGATATVGTAPSGMTITPDGGFLYVSNSGSSNVSAFAICNQVVTSCSVPTIPDGALTPVSGSPFSAGLGPSSIVTAPSGKFLFVVDRQSNQISEYKLATGTGELTPNTQATISTGVTPAGVTLRVGTTVISATQGTTDYLYVANLGSSTMTAYSFDSTAGVLGLVGSPVITGGQPSALAAK
jgi:6-phosphogluconolactonase (cycloisomerase 2 family)